MIQGTKFNLDNKSAVVLHSYNYRDSSLIINFFLSEYGLVSAIAKGIKGKKSKQNQFILLQPFQRLIISLTGKQELLILTSVEFNTQNIRQPSTELNNELPIQRWDLTGKPLYCAYYINELLLRLLPTHTDCHEIFTLYEQTLEILAHFSNPKLTRNTPSNTHTLNSVQITIHYEVPLRIFELKLLEYLGYGLNLHYDIQTELPIEINKQYYYVMGSGPIEKPTVGIKCLSISGNTLINLSNNQLTDQKTLQESKQLLKWALAEHLGDKPLKSREMFKQLYISN